MPFSRVPLSRKKLPGFSIGEVLLAAFVLTVGILATEGLITFSYKTTTNAQDLIIASELAQEGVELTRNLRDNNLTYREDHKTTACLSSTSGLCDPFNGFSSGSNRKCIIDYNDSGLDCSGAASNMVLALTGNFYQQGASGRFYRLIKTDLSGSGTDVTARVRSFVAWQDPGSHLNSAVNDIAWCTIVNKCVYTELYLTAWK